MIMIHRNLDWLILLLFLVVLSDAAAAAAAACFLHHHHHPPHRYHYHHKDRNKNAHYYYCAAPFGVDDTDDPRYHDLATALRRMQILQSQQEQDGDDDDGLLLSLFPQRLKNLVRVGPSSIDGAGMGVFARQNIKAGTIVGFFPLHALGVDFDFADDNDKNDDESSVMCLAANKEDQAYFDNRRGSSNDEEPNYVHYLIGSRKIGSADFESTSKLFLDVRPGLALGDAWISHFINDGATVRTNTEQGMLDYYKLSRNRKNCVNIPFASAPLIATITTQKVKKNQELFTTYGCLYWAATAADDADAAAAAAAASEQPNHNNGDDVDVVTEQVLLEAKATAQDIFVAMQSARVTYARQQQELEQRFAEL